MKVPRWLCGKTKDAAAASRRAVTRLARGGPWIDPDAEMIDDRDAPGLFILNGSSPLFSDENVAAYAPFWELGKAIIAGRIARDVAVRAFDAALDQPWSVLGLHSQANYHWLEDPARADRFLAAMVRHWDA